MEETSQQHEGLPRWAWGLILSGATFALLLLFHLGESSPLRKYGELLEHKALDALFQLREDWAPTTPDEDIVIVVIDDEGVEYFENQSFAGPHFFDDQPYPWPRMFHARLVEYMQAAGARAVFFDFLFTSPSVYNGYFEDDAQFAEACRAAGNVYQALHFKEPVGEGTDEVEEVLDIGTEESRAELARLRELRQESFDPGVLESVQLRDGAQPSRTFASVQLPLPPLVETAKGMGAINADMDTDGVVRRVRPVLGFGGASYPSIHVALARDLLGIEEVTSDGRTLRMDGRVVPLDEDGLLLVNWHGGALTYPYHQFHKLILGLGTFMKNPDFTPDPFFQDKIVLVGTSAVGQADIKANPFGSLFPGVEAHAAALDNFLNDDFLSQPARSTRLAWTAVLMLLAGQLLSRRQGAGVAVVTLLVLLVLQFGLTFLLFTQAHLWFDQVIPVIGLVTLFGGAQTVQYFTEGKQKRAIRGAFQRYLPPSVVNEVLKVPLDELKLGGDRRELTVFFSDIRGFTGISETLGPEELVSMLNVYLGEMTDVISRNGGTLDKYIGDCIMAFWGAPLSVDQPAISACMSALENQERLAELRERFLEQGLPELHARIGINTGPMLVGNMGSDQHFSYTVMGDAVNLASRLEGAGKQYGVTILIGSNTYEAARERIEVREIDLIRVKGKQEPERAYELLARAGELPETLQRLREVYLQGLEAYRRADFEAAMAHFEAALEILPGDGPSRVYLERCLLYKNDPPPADWDGVFAMATK